MPKELDIRLESLIYTAQFAEPVFELWGAGQVIIGSLYHALSEYGVRLEHINIVNNVSASAPVATVELPSTSGKMTVRFAFNRMEFEFHNFTAAFFESIPTVLLKSTAWLRNVPPKNFRFASHRFGYYSHAFIKGGTTKETLDLINPRVPRGLGIGLGNGTVFHTFLPEKDWTLKLSFEESLALTGALFVSFVIETSVDAVDYAAVMSEGRACFNSVLGEMNLVIPDPVQ
jgi:hypothetical protein